MTVAERRSRFEELSRPRGLHPAYEQNRISVYWKDRLPMLPRNGRTKANLTARQQELVIPKRRVDSAEAFCDPMWPVSRGAMTYEPTPRIHELSKSKAPPDEWKAPRRAQSEVSDHALNAEPTPRVQELAKPKERISLPVIEPKQWDWGDWEDRISRTALKANASERTERLAVPKSCPPSFRPARTCMWPVSHDAKQFTPTERLQTLSMPRARTMISDDYDPYHISRGALQASITPRLAELAVPLARKTVTK